MRSLTTTCDDSGLVHSEPAPNVHEWRLPGGDLAPGAGGDFRVAVSVGAAHQTGLDVVTRLRISGDTPDADPSNNEAVWRAAVPWHIWYYFPLYYHYYPER